VSSVGARLAVLGSPIGHSKSPALHAAAYRELGLDWDYGIEDVDGTGLATFIEECGADWRGLSLTMPLKRDVLPLLARTDPLVETTGSANTVLFDWSTATRQLVGFNTDVYGISAAFERHGHRRIDTARILGGGATAASAVVALAHLGAQSIRVSVRSPERAEALLQVGRASDVAVTIDSLGDPAQAGAIPDAVVSTLPNGSDVAIDFAPGTLEHAVLLDVAYHPWPSALAQRWAGDVISGLEMLVLQALMQVRIFVGGDPTVQLDREPRVLAAMRASVGL
jgi:shikimate dehydrogenase